MAVARSLLSGFFSLFFFLFLHIGCCFAPGPSQRSDQNSSRSKRKKISPSLSPSPPSSTTISDENTRCRGSLSLTSVGSYLKNILSFHRSRNAKEETGESRPPAPSILTSSPLRSFPVSPHAPADQSPSHPGTKAGISSDIAGTKQSLVDSKKHSFASRADIFPCSVCGEVFSKPHLLDLHQAMKHSLSELSEADSGMNIVRIIFLSGWKGSAAPTVRRVLKIQHNQRSLARFEECRDQVRTRAARRCGGIASGMDERCIADGNERLRFYCSTTLCSLGAGGVCGSPYCCTCGILRHGFAGKQTDMDGIATYSSSWGAHLSLPEELEKEFSFLQVRRAMLVCRVVVGRVAHGDAGELLDLREGMEKVSMFDSVVVPAGRGCGGAGYISSLASDEELLVFNPRAVLPCFVILYAA